MGSSFVLRLQFERISLCLRQEGQQEAGPWVWVVVLACKQARKAYRRSRPFKERRFFYEPKEF
jgi:hypothetical protein